MPSLFRLPSCPDRTVSSDEGQIEDQRGKANLPCSPRALRPIFIAKSTCIPGSPESASNTCLEARPYPDPTEKEKGLRFFPNSMPPLEPPLPVPSYAELPSHPTTGFPDHQRKLSSDVSPITFKRTADGRLGTSHRRLVGSLLARSYQRPAVPKVRGQSKTCPGA